MNETRVLCDVEDCKKPNAVHQSFYKESRMDGAGSTEHLYYAFDLCPHHLDSFLHNVLDGIHRNPLTTESALLMLKAFRIKTREE